MRPNICCIAFLQATNLRAGWEGKRMIPDDTGVAHGNQHPHFVACSRLFQNPHPVLSVADDASVFRTIANVFELT
jgi:hypothetical protein